MKKFSMMLLAVVTMLVSLSVPVEASSRITLYNVMSEQAVRDDIKSEFVDSDTGINFAQDPVYYPDEEDDSTFINNGKGVYMISSTAKDLYPIYYYRGDVKDNNVLFGGFCWKIVRTTDTGGVKIIYNGESNDDGTCVDSIKSFDNSLNLGWGYWNAEYNGYMSPNTFELPKSNYEVEYKDMSWMALAGKEEQGTKEISGTYYYSSEVRYENGKYTLVNPKAYTFRKMESDEDYDEEYEKINDMETKYSCLNEGVTCNEVIYISELIYEYRYKGLYYITLQNGETKESIIEKLKPQKFIIGNDVTYQNGKYTLKNTVQTSLMNPDVGNRHYTCFTNSDVCEEVAYIYDKYFETEDHSGVSVYYLSNGDTVETLQAEYDVYKSLPNEKDSLMKTTLDKWYSEHMQDYTKYLEDTVWCSDRSIYYGNLDKNSTYLLYDDVRFASNQRNFPKYWNDVDFIAKPSLTCANKNDNFTVSEKNGNGKLTYPVATITSDELTYAGSQTPEGDYCLNFSGITMSMTGDGWIPYIDWDYLLRNWENYDPYKINSEIMPVGCGGSMAVVLPAVSLKRNMAIAGGNGTAENPYTLEEVPESQIWVPNTSDRFMNHILIFGLSFMMLLLGFYINRKIRYEE